MALNKKDKPRLIFAYPPICNAGGPFAATTKQVIPKSGVGPLMGVDAKSSKKAETHSCAVAILMETCA